jgi:hypothetical protein
VTQTFNSSTQKAETGTPLEFEASLVYRVSSRTARNLVSKKKKKKRRRRRKKEDEEGEK